MILKYGAYSHANNEASVIVRKTPKFNEGGFAVAMLERWEIAGFLQAANQTALTAAIDSLSAAYAIQGQDLALYLDDGATRTSHAIASAATIGGTRVVQAPSFPQGAGAEYSTFRSYAIAVEAEIPTVGPQTLLFFEESLVFSGGGPRFVFLQTLNGFPQKQQVAQTTPHQAQQSGRAVGYGAYPFPPAPIWPAAEHRDRRRIDYKTPNRQGTTGAQVSFVEYEVSWAYAFEEATPLSGIPTVWV